MTLPLQLAESRLLLPSGLDSGGLDRAFGTLLGPGIDFGDLYFQHARRESWTVEDGIVKDGAHSIEQGVGVRAISGEKTGFAYSDDINALALADAAKSARAIARDGAAHNARALVPGMLARGSGYLLNTASAAGLLASLNSMPYGVTKNAAVALAEHLAIQYGDRGIRVSVLCPQSVQTGMTTPGPSAARVDGVLQSPEVARMVIEAMAEERFLILLHPQVAEYMQRKASSRDRWLTGMRRLRDKIYGAPQSA